MSSQQLFTTGMAYAPSAQQTFNPVEGGSLYISGNGTVAGTLTAGALSITGGVTEGAMTTSSLHVTGTTALDGSVTCGSTLTTGTNAATTGALSCTAITSTGTVSCGTNACTVGALSAGAAGTQPVTINASTMQFNTAVPTPSIAGGLALGTTALPWSSFVLGSSAGTGSQFYQEIPYNQTAVQGWFGAGPTTLIAAPGAGKVILINLLRFSTTVSTAFAGGGNMSIVWAGTVTPLNTAILAANVTAAASQWINVIGTTGSAVTFANCSGLGITITNLTGAFTGGAGSSVNIKIWYRIEAT